MHPTYSTDTSARLHIDGISKDSTTSETKNDLIVEQWPNGKAPPNVEHDQTNRQFPCKVEGCDKAFIREADLDRHGKCHEAGPKSFDCCAARCPRKGTKGFWRKDKLKDHLDRKHPELEVEPWFILKDNRYPWRLILPSNYRFQGYRDIKERGEYEAHMLKKEFVPHPKDPRYYNPLSKQNALRGRYD
ncbi:MAG: hypothetical protein Q9219_002959 [cf. Caloplaca sp. 3 TL-2023]